MRAAYALLPRLVTIDISILLERVAIAQIPTVPTEVKVLLWILAALGLVFGAILAAHQVFQAIEYFHEKWLALRPRLGAFCRRSAVMSLLVFILVGAGVGTALGAGAWAWLRKSASEEAPDKKALARPGVDWTAIADGLRPLKTEFSNAFLMFVGDQRPKLESLRGSFGLAGWEISVNPSAFDGPHQGGWGRYYVGTEVRGHNQVLVERVAKILSDAGLPDVFTIVEPLKIPHDNPKWNRLEQRVTILLGYPTAQEARSRSNSQTRAQQPTADRQAVRERLVQFIAEGERIQKLCRTLNYEHDPPAREINSWVAGVERFLRSTLDDSYVTRFRAETVPVEPGGPFAGSSRMIEAWKAVESKLVNLREIAKDFTN